MDEKSLLSSPILATTKSSSWLIVRGSLDDAVTYESSFSVINSDSDSDSNHTVDLKPKDPLILRRPSLDSGPCEITILFKQKHEIKQVYVRSTARVYEIYHAAAVKSGNEYLCTVRCGMAARDEERDGDISLSTSLSGSNGCVDEGHSRTESGSSTNDDGWVDVKVPNPSRFDEGGNSLSKENKGCTERFNQDLFEATAEIADVDPIMSVTLRLLSIQSGDHIYISEVYVFADPVASADSDSSVNERENSSGSALMSMLVPTLLQLSKSRATQMQERNNSAAGESKHQDIEQKSTGADFTCNIFQSGRSPSNMLNGASVHISLPEEPPVQTPNPQNRPNRESDFTCDYLERTLGQLVSRVAKIEQFCLRFEENMLKPICSMEARLERVEQQLESFVKNPQFSGTHGTRISAPEFESNSSCTDGNDYPGTRKCDSITKDDYNLGGLSDTSSSGNFVQSDEYDMPSSSTSGCQLLPSLVVTAPDFSFVDDEDENDDAIEAVEDSPKDSPKKPSSIDDALASALAGFIISSASTNPLKRTDVVEKAAEFLSVEGEPVLSSVHVSGDNDDVETASICHKDFVVTEQESHAVDNSCEERMEAVDRLDHTFEEGASKEPLGSSVDNVLNLDKGEINDSNLITAIGSGEDDNDLNQTFISNYFDTPALVSRAPSNDMSVCGVEVAGGKIDSSYGEKIAEEDPDILHNFLNLSSPALVDFQIPILEVKFLSLGNSPTRSPLEALLTGVPESQSEALCVKEDNGSSSIMQNDLVIIENEELAASDTSNNQMFFLDNYESGYMPSNREEELQDPYKCSNQDCASLI